MQIQLAVQMAEESGAKHYRFDLDRPVVLGRGPESPVPLDGTPISREHLAFELEGSVVYVRDFSSNGTWVNGELIGRGNRRSVAEHDEISVPGYSMTFRLVGARVLSAPPATQPSRMAPVREFLHSLTGLELYTLFVAASGITLIVAYLQVS